MKLTTNIKIKAQVILLPVLFLLITGTNPVSASDINKDSLTLVNAQWSVTEVEPGLTLKQVHFNSNELFSSNQFISILELSADSQREVDIVPSPILIETNLLAQKKDAIAAINGSFFKFNYERNTKDYNSVDYIRKEGKVLAPNTYVGAHRAMHQKGALAIFRGGFYILKADKLKTWEKYIQADHIITSGPLLRAAGKDAQLFNSSFYTARHPRTAVAKRKNGDIIFMTVDGRSTQSQGMSLEELRNVLSWMGASYIINLDGGGSTTMYVKDISDNGIVNHPSDNKKFDNKGMRKVANIIIIK